MGIKTRQGQKIHICVVIIRDLVNNYLKYPSVKVSVREL